MDLLTSYRKQFALYRKLGGGAMAQLSFEEITRNDPAGTNSIALIVKHMAGNMRSRWTDFLTTDGEKPWRDRENEFVDDFSNREALETAWAEGWSILEEVLSTLTPDQLDRVIYIRNEGHTVYEAINRQLAHYSYHVGQMVLLAKQIRGAEWRSLSIPRAGSELFNAEKFGHRRGGGGAAGAAG